MRREFHVRFCEGLGVRFPRATRLVVLVGEPRGPDQTKAALYDGVIEKLKLTEKLQKDVGLELHPEKTLLTALCESPIKFLGYHARVRETRRGGRWVATLLIPRQKTQRLRTTIKRLFDRSTLHRSLKQQLKELNALLRGWGSFYRHARGAKAVFQRLDHYVWHTVQRWLRKKHRGATRARLTRRYGYSRPGCRGTYWQDGGVHLFRVAQLRVAMFRKPAHEMIPDFARFCGEPGA